MARQRLLSALKLFCLVAAGAGVAIVATQSQADGRVVGLLLVLAALLAVVIAAVVTGAAHRTGAGRAGPRSWSRDDDDWQRRSDDPLAVVSAMTALSVATGATCDDGRPADPSGGACHGADSSASYGSDASCGADASSSYGSDASSSCGSDSSSF